jgi:hypothetical protein
MAKGMITAIATFVSMIMSTVMNMGTNMDMITRGQLLVMARAKGR